MSQKDEIYEKARQLGIVDGRVNGSELETLQRIANEVGMDHYNGLSNDDTDELQRKLEQYERDRNSNILHQNDSNNLANRGLNAATGGAWNKARNAPILGAAAKKAENKLNNKLNNSRLVNKLANPANHTRPNLGAQTKEEKNKVNNPKSNEVGSRNLKSSLANKAKNFLSKRKKKNEAAKDGSDTSNTNGNNTNEQKEISSPLDDAVAKAKARFKVKVIIYGSLFLVIVLFILAIFVAIFGIDLSQSFPAVNSTTYGTDDFQSTYEEGTKEYEEEISYYEKLKKVSEDYAENNDEELRTNYIHAVLFYIYYLPTTTEASENDNTIKIDYAKMESKVDDIVELMKPSDNTKTIDYDKDGEFYNNLKNSSFFKNYYKEALKTETASDILDDIFELAEGIESLTVRDETVMTDQTTVTVTKSDKDEKTKEKVKVKKTISINDYLTGVIYANTNSLNNSEKVKAYTIAYSTNIVAQNKSLSITSNNAQMSDDYCDIKEGCSYNSDSELVDGPGERSSKNATYYNGGYYYKKPLASSDINSLNSNIKSVFGNVLITVNGTYTKLDLSKIDGLGDGDYKTILNSAYKNHNIKNIGENSYILDASYGDEKVLTSVIFYDQGDYSNYSFCGLKKETIKSSGCGVTSMAMVVSTYEKNKKYDPIYMNTEATNKKMCGSGSGTAQAFFCKKAKEMGYKCLSGGKYDKSYLNLVLKHLSQGHLAVVRIGPGHFTGGGHYMVIGGVDPDTQKVYIYDPNNNSNSSYRKTGNGWYSFNDIIVKEAYNFYIIWKG